MFHLNPLRITTPHGFSAEVKVQPDEALNWSKKAIELGPPVHQFKDTLA